MSSPAASAMQEDARASSRLLPLPEAACPIRDVLAHVGGKWSMLAVCVLSLGDRRFGELRRSLPGISQRMLSQTLRVLQRDGLVERRVLPTTPPSVIYGLTELGRSLLEPLNHMIVWANSRFPAILAARRTYFTENPASGSAEATAAAADR